MKITGAFTSKDKVLASLPFFFNEDNSNIAVSAFIDGDVELSIEFGTGLGWDSLESTLAEASQLSFAWGLYSLGY